MKRKTVKQHVFTVSAAALAMTWTQHHRPCGGCACDDVASAPPAVWRDALAMTWRRVFFSFTSASAAMWKGLGTVCLVPRGPLDAGPVEPTPPPTCPFAALRGIESQLGPPMGLLRTSRCLSGETEAGPERDLRVVPGSPSSCRPQVVFSRASPGAEDQHPWERKTKTNGGVFPCEAQGHTFYSRGRTCPHVSEERRFSSSAQSRRETPAAPSQNQGLGSLWPPTILCPPHCL